MGWHCATRKNFDGDTRSIRHTLRGCSLVYFCCCVAAVGVVAAVVAAVVVAAVVAAVVVVAVAFDVGAVVVVAAVVVVGAVEFVNHVEAEARLSGVKPLSCSSHRQDTRGGGSNKFTT